MLYRWGGIRDGFEWRERRGNGGGDAMVDTNQKTNVRTTSNTQLNIRQPRIPLPSHKFLGASRRCPVREVFDFWECTIPWPGSIEQVSATEDRVDCWGWEGEKARIIRSAVSPSVYRRTTLPLSASSCALNIAALMITTSLGMPTLF